MNITRKELVYKSRQDKFNVVFMGDEHIGNAGCMEDKIREHVEYIRTTPNTYWIGMGDKIDAVCPTDKRFDGSSLPSWMKIEDVQKLPKVQADRWINIYKPIANKCLGLVNGNHEDVISKRYYNDIHAYICGSMGVFNLGFSGFVRLNFVYNGDKRGYGRDVDIFCCHGYGGGRYVGSKINKVKEISNNFVADIYVMGHCHDKISYPKNVVYVNSEMRLSEKKQYLIATGSFFKTYVQDKDSYAEKALYPSSSTGVTKAVIRPKANRWVKNDDGTRLQHDYVDIHIEE